VHLLRFEEPGRLDGLVHAVTGRDLDLSLGADRRVLAGHLGFDGLWTPVQVHGREVVELDGPWDAAPRADAVIVRRPGLLAGVLGADCPLLLLVDPRRRALALVHSGWRGTVAGVVPAAVARLASACGSRPSDLLVGAGPSICADHYEVGPEVLVAVARALPGVPDLVRPTGDGRGLLDLWRAIAAQLGRAGVDPARVERLDTCTWEATDAVYSHRREGGRAGRHAIVAGWAG